MTGIIEVDGKDAEYVRAMFEILNLRMDNERLRAELAAIKPSWDDAPEWATYRAYNASGPVWFAAEPSVAPYTYHWQSSFASEPAYLNNWRDTLERRPEDT